MMIKTAIRTPGNMTFVFGEDGRQAPEYQGWYREVRDSILRNAGIDTIFKRWPDASAEPEIVSRDNW
jgi:hypothetical protein